MSLRPFYDTDAFLNSLGGTLERLQGVRVHRVAPKRSDGLETLGRRLDVLQPYWDYVSLDAAETLEVHVTLAKFRRF